MTVAETNEKQLFYVSAERHAVVTHVYALLAGNAEEAQNLVANGWGLEVGYLGSEFTDSDYKIIDIADADDPPLGVDIIEPDVLRNMQSVSPTQDA